MNFELTPDQLAIRNHVSDLLKEVCPPEYAAKCDEEQTPPRAAFDALAKNGWLGIIGPEEYGGSGGGATELAILLGEVGYHFEELGREIINYSRALKDEGPSSSEFPIDKKNLLEAMKSELKRISGDGNV